jgi:hypothetical protein
MEFGINYLHFHCTPTNNTHATIVISITFENVPKKALDVRNHERKNNIKNNLEEKAVKK